VTAFIRSFVYISAETLGRDNIARADRFVDREKKCGSAHLSDPD
jgi:hypothetical protein